MTELGALIALKMKSESPSFPVWGLEGLSDY